MDLDLKAIYLFVFLGVTWLQASRYVENCSRIFSVLKLVEERVKQPEKVTFHISHGHKISVHCMSTNICSLESIIFPHIVENGVRTLRSQSHHLALPSKQSSQFNIVLEEKNSLVALELLSTMHCNVE